MTGRGGKKENISKSSSIHRLFFFVIVDEKKEMASIIEKRAEKRDRIVCRFLPKLVSHLTQTHAEPTSLRYTARTNLTVIFGERIEVENETASRCTIMLDQCLQFHADGGGRVLLSANGNDGQPN